MGTQPGGARNKASRIRKALAKGDDVTDIDKLWFADYEEKAGNARPDFGASASSTKIHRSETIEENKAAVGTGTAAAAAASLALATREEGRRLDALTTNAVGALHEAVEVYKSVCLSLLERTKILEETHVSMLETIRSEYLARVDVEGELRDKEREQTGSGDTANAMLMGVLAKHLGIEVEVVQQSGAAAKSNGAAKKRA